MVKKFYILIVLAALAQLESACCEQSLNKLAEKRIIHPANTGDTDFMWLLLTLKLQEMMRSQNMRLGWLRRTETDLLKSRTAIAKTTRTPVQFDTLPYDFFPRFG